MNEFTSLMLTYLSIYLGVVLLCLAAINFFMGGVFFPWLKVKTSRGKLVLVRVHTIVQDYYKPGMIDKGFLIFKDKVKEERRISVSDGAIYRGMGVNNLNVDDETNAVIKNDFTTVSGFDAVKYSNLYERALTRPDSIAKELKIILILLVLVLLGVAACLYIGFDLSDKVTALSNVPVASGGNLAAGTV